MMDFNGIDPTDEYVSSCARKFWGFEKSEKLAQRINRLKQDGKQYAFTARLRTFIIKADSDMLSKLMLAWGRSGPFYDSKVKEDIKKLMGE